jgi:hypothetical protein
MSLHGATAEPLRAVEALFSKGEGKMWRGSRLVAALWLGRNVR